MRLSALVRGMIDLDGSPLASYQLRELSEGWTATRAEIKAYSEAYATHLETGENRPDPSALDAARLRS